MDILLLNLGSDIQGEVTLDRYAGQVEALSFSHGISQGILHGLTGRTGTVGHPQHQELTVTKYLDLASTSILDHCDRGAVLPQVTLTAGQADESQVTPFWVVTLKAVIISSISMGGGGGSKPVENLTLNYTAIHWLYTGPADAAGQSLSNSASWDLTTNSAGPVT